MQITLKRTDCFLCLSLDVSQNGLVRFTYLISMLIGNVMVCQGYVLDKQVKDKQVKHKQIKHEKCWASNAGIEYIMLRQNTSILSQCSVNHLKRG